MLKWYTNEPPRHTPILAKFKSCDIDTDPCYYYMVKRERLFGGSDDYLVEDQGEQYAHWRMEDLIAWTTKEELDKSFMESQRQEEEDMNEKISD